MRRLGCTATVTGPGASSVDASVRGGDLSGHQRGPIWPRVGTYLAITGDFFVATDTDHIRQRSVVFDPFHDTYRSRFCLNRGVGWMTLRNWAFGKANTTAFGAISELLDNPHLSLHQVQATGAPGPHS